MVIKGRRTERSHRSLSDALSHRSDHGHEYLVLQVWRLIGRGSNPSGGEIFRTCPDRPWGPPTLLYNGYRLPFLEVKRPGRGVDHSIPSNAEVKERVEL
jgi:hypothetical protein